MVAISGIVVVTVYDLIFYEYWFFSYDMFLFFYFFFAISLYNPLDNS